MIRSATTKTRGSHPAARRGDNPTSAVLDLVDGWRNALIRKFPSSDESLSNAAHRHAVDRALIQILFARMCEAHGIGQIGNTRTVVHDLFLGVENDGDDIRTTLDELDQSDLRFNFAALPPDILGMVYERLRCNADQIRVRAAETRVRKSSGVYYTPVEIIDYIVERTIGTVLAQCGDRRDDDPTRTIRVLDPACGGGWFLLGAYRRLLNWYLAFYIANDPAARASRRNAAIERERITSGNSRNCRAEISENSMTEVEWRLTDAERVRILRDHIYGVDIDPNAVEITKMSLVVMAIEGLSREDYCEELSELAERTLRDLSGNIKCGNALIGPDCGADGSVSNQAFDWHAEFPEIMGPRPDAGPVAPGLRCGFDAVIGNPPYVSYSGRQAVEIPEDVRNYFAREYGPAGWMTAHGLFVRRSVRDLSRRFTSFIVPDQVGHLDGYAEVRRAVAERAGLVEVRYWGEDVFDGVVSPALTFVADREHRGETEIIDARGRRSRSRLADGQGWHVAGRDGPSFEVRVPTHSLGKLVADPGVHTGNCAGRLIVDASSARPGCVPILEGRQIAAFRCEPPTKMLNLAYRPADGEYFTIRPIARYTSAPFVIRQTAGFPIVGPRRHADYFRNSLLALYSPSDGTDVRYLVGLLNSRLIRFLYTRAVRESRQKAFPQVKVRSLRALPIRTIDMSIVRQRELHDRIVERVAAALELRASVETGADAEKETQFREVIAKIDRLVYEAYELTASQVETVEHSLASDA